MISHPSKFEFTERASEAGVFRAGYDAAESTNRRKAPRTILRAEDDVADKTIRRQLTATTRDVRRNISVARWMINKHLDFVVSHNFKARTGDPGFDRELETFLKFASHKKRFDIRRMHPRRRFMRILEASRTVDGDVFGLKLRGGSLQGVEGDRVRDPSRRASRRGWVHGVELNPNGSPRNYAIHRRVNKSSFQWERNVRANRIIPFGYFDRFDQYRGVSPMASAIRDLGDVYEGFDYALAREKVNQLFTLVLYRDAQESFFETDGDNVDTEREPYEVDFSKGPNVLDLDAGDRADFLRAPGTETNSQQFWDTVIAIALKSLDIPFSFYREDFTNFFGSRAALLLYLKSCKDKRLDVVDFLDEWFRWRLREGELLGEIRIPSGFDVENVCNAWTWIPDGVPWWNPLQEVKANVEAINNHLRSREEIRQEQFGDSWENDVLPVLVKEKELLAEAELPVPTVSSTLEIMPSE